MLLSGFALWLAGALTALPAAPPPDWMEWRVPAPPADCGDRDTFETELAARLGRPPAQAAATLGVSIQARIDRVEAGGSTTWIGEIRVVDAHDGAQGVRRVEHAGDSCRPLVDALGLVTTLILQAAGDRPPAAVPPAADLELPNARPSPRRPPSGWRLAVAAGPMTGLGALPAPYLGGQATAIVRRGAIGLLVGGSLAWRSGAAAAPMQGVDLSRAALDVGWCPIQVARGSRALDLCAGAEVTRLHAAGFGFPMSATDDRWSIAALAQAQARQQVGGPVFVAAGLELTVAAPRDRVGYTDASGAVREIFQVAPVAGEGQLLVGLLF